MKIGRNHYKIAITCITTIFLAVPHFCLANNYAWVFIGNTKTEASAVTNKMKGTIDKILETVSDKNLEKEPSTRQKLLRDIIDQRFNYRQMAMRSLARNWKERTPEELGKFTELFKRQLEQTYATQLESYNSGPIEYTETIIKKNFALVKTKMKHGGNPIKVDYKMILEDNDWQVYDFVVNGVSIIRNYRSQFSKIITENSFDALLQKMNTNDSTAVEAKQASNNEKNEGIFSATHSLPKINF